MTEEDDAPLPPLGKPPAFPRVRDPATKVYMAVGETLAIIERALPHLYLAAARGELGAAQLVADAEAIVAAVKYKRRNPSDGRP